MTTTIAGDIEIRQFDATLEARDLGGMEFKVQGHASVTDYLYDMGAYSEKVQPGAFTETLQQRPNVSLLINHGSGSGMPLARTTVPPGQVGHLSLAEDYNGLHFSAQLDREDPEAQLLMRRITSGLVTGTSFAFRVTKQTWNDDRSIRTIQSVDLDKGDVSCCTNGANPAGQVDARSRPAVAAELALYQYRVRASRLGASPVSRTRHLEILNEAGRQTPARRNITVSQARAIANGLRLRQR